jgi:hypothetical protein
MAGFASFNSNRSMFERKWPALVAVAIEAARFIRVHHARHPGLERSVRIVAVDTAHYTFRQRMMMRFLKLRPRGNMTSGALRVNSCFPGTRCGRRVNLVARNAGYLAFSVRSLDAADVTLRVQVAPQTSAISGRGCQFRRLQNVGGGGGLGVFSARPMTGFARATLPSAFLAGIDRKMFVFLECFSDILVAGSAGFRTGVLRLGCCRLRRRWLRGCLLRMSRSYQNKQGRRNYEQHPPEYMERPGHDLIRRP